MSNIHGVVISLLVCYAYAAPLSQPKTSDDRDAEVLNKLLEDLKISMQSYSTPSPPENEVKVKQPIYGSSQPAIPLPRKRNCAINFSNDCGTWETAYMNGAKNFFGQKRRLNDNFNSNDVVRRVAPAVNFGDSARGMSSEYLDDNLLSLESTVESYSGAKILQYLISLQKELDIERNQNDKLCIQLTGKSCDEFWSK